MKPDNCFRIGSLWGDQQWADFFAGGRTTAFLESQEGGPRIFVKWTKHEGVTGLVLGWCPPGTWLPSVSLPFAPCGALRWILPAGGVGAPQATWSAELRALLLVDKPYLEAPPLSLLQAWEEEMFAGAQEVGFETKNTDTPSVSLDWVELVERPRADVRRVFTQCGLNGEVVEVKGGPQSPSLILQFAFFGSRVRFGWKSLHSNRVILQDGETQLPNDNLHIWSDLVPIGLGFPKEEAHPRVRRLFDADVEETEVRSILNAMASAVTTGRNLPESASEPAKPPKPASEPEPPGPPEPVSKQPPAPKYGWTLNLSDRSDGKLTGSVTIFQPATENETSREVGKLTFNLNDQDKRFYQDLVRGITQETPPWVEGAFSQLLTLMRAAHKK